MDEAPSLSGAAMTTSDEDEVMARAAARDPNAFSEIYELHRTAVYRYLRSRAASDDEAGELSAVTFERALAAIGRFKASGGGLSAWLLRIARNTHIDATRRQAVRATDGHPSMEAVTEQRGSALEDDIILRTMVASLPGLQRDAIQLRFAAGLTSREIGAVLGVSEDAAQKHIERALRTLKEEVTRVD